MATSPAFSFGHSIDEIGDALPLGGLDEATLRAVHDVLDMLIDRDSDVEDFLTGTLAGQKDKTTITATAGGATITFAKTFPRTPVILVANPNGSGGYTASVVDASISTSSFKVQIFNGAVEVVAGNFKVPWIAA